MFFNRPIETPFAQQDSDFQADILQDFAVLPADAQQALANPVTLDEIRAALATMKNSASPGMWGLSVEAIALLCQN